MPSRAPAPIKFPLHLWSIHVHVSFASVENLVMSVTEKGFEERTATVFEKEKTPNCGNVNNQLFNKLNISGIFFYFPKCLGK